MERKGVRKFKNTAAGAARAVSARAAARAAARTAIYLEVVLDFKFQSWLSEFCLCHYLLAFFCINASAARVVTIKLFKT